MPRFRGYIPLYDSLSAFDLLSCLLLIIPLGIGFLIGRYCSRRASNIWLILSAFLTVMITVLYWFQPQYHLFGWIGLLIGPFVTAFCLGVLAGNIILKIKKEKN